MNKQIESLEESNQIGRSNPAPDVESTAPQYEKPQIIYRAPLEAVAAVCSPGSGGKTSQTGCGVAFS